MLVSIFSLSLLSHSNLFLLAISNPYNGQQSTSSNPWNMPTSAFPNATTSTGNNNTSGSISPPTHGLTTGTNLLYPTIAGNRDNNSNNPSPLPSAASRKTPESFLGDKFSTLVNLDQLITEPKGNAKKNTRQSIRIHRLFLGAINPFGSTAPRAPNPFANMMKPPTLDQLSSSTNVGFTTGSTLPPPLIPSTFNATTSSINTNNPFM